MSEVAAAEGKSGGGDGLAIFGNVAGQHEESCAHGIERWRSNCGCNAGHAGWNQEWRGPLRSALDWLRGELTRVFEREGAGRLRDPWAARDAYIDVILTRTPEVIDAFVAAHGQPGLDGEGRLAALRLLEMQRHAMLMYTSCGWFFDELSGIETVQVMKYASSAAQLGQAEALYTLPEVVFLLLSCVVVDGPRSARPFSSTPTTSGHSATGFPAVRMPIRRIRAIDPALLRPVPTTSRRTCSSRKAYSTSAPTASVA